MLRYYASLLAVSIVCYDSSVFMILFSSLLERWSIIRPKCCFSPALVYSRFQLLVILGSSFFLLLMLRSLLPYQQKSYFKHLVLKHFKTFSFFAMYLVCMLITTSLLSFSGRWNVRSVMSIDFTYVARTFHMYNQRRNIIIRSVSGRMVRSLTSMQKVRCSNLSSSFLFEFFLEKFFLGFELLK